MPSKRLVNKPHLRKVASLPCCLCPADDTGWHDETVVPHHLLIGEGVYRGGKLKPGDDKVIPVCWKHHDILHRIGSDLEYLKTHGIDGVALAHKLYHG